MGLERVASHPEEQVRDRQDPERLRVEGLTERELLFHLVRLDASPGVDRTSVGQQTHFLGPVADHVVAMGMMMAGSTIAVTRYEPSQPMRSIKRVTIGSTTIPPTAGPAEITLSATPPPPEPAARQDAGWDEGDPRPGEGHDSPGHVELPERRREVQRDECQRSHRDPTDHRAAGSLARPTESPASGAATENIAMFTTAPIEVSVRLQPKDSSIGVM